VVSAKPSQPEKVRQRARRHSDGHRTTVRVPAELHEHVEAVAASLGTTPNDALILLAERGSRFYAQELEMAAAAEFQMQAILHALEAEADPDAQFPSAEEWRAAALLMRTGKYGPVF
jgi:hypothetical protein